MQIDVADPCHYLTTGTNIPTVRQRLDDCIDSANPIKISALQSLINLYRALGKIPYLPRIPSSIKTL